MHAVLKGRLLSGAILAACSLAFVAGCEENKNKTTGLPRPQFQPPVVAFHPPAAQPVISPPKATSSSSGNSSSFGRAPAPSGVNANGIPRAWTPSVKANQFFWIIIHHTATPAGAMARIDSSHRAKGWDCIGYDFVVGNGTESKDGQVEVGPRWTRQMIGAHTQSPDGSNKYNKHGIGIVMVGNFDETKPSAKQMAATSQLVAYMMKTYKVPADRVWGHRNAKATDCPGKFTDVLAIRRAASKQLADAGDTLPPAFPVPKFADAEEGEISPWLKDLYPEPAFASNLPTGELLHDAAMFPPAAATGE